MDYFKRYDLANLIRHAESFGIKVKFVDIGISSFNYDTKTINSQAHEN